MWARAVLQPLLRLIRTLKEAVCQPNGPELKRYRHCFTLASTHVMSLEEREAQAKSFAYGSASIDNPDVTREVIDNAFIASRDGDTQSR